VTDGRIRLASSFDRKVRRFGDPLRALRKGHTRAGRGVAAPAFRSPRHDLPEVQMRHARLRSLHVQPLAQLQVTQWKSKNRFRSPSLAHLLSRRCSLPCAGDGGVGRTRRLSNVRCFGVRGLKIENDKGAGVGSASSGRRQRARTQRAPSRMRHRPHDLRRRLVLPLPLI
jgi:hypothetical protein